VRILFDDRPAKACSTGIGRYVRSLLPLLRGTAGHDVFALSDTGAEFTSEEELELELPALLALEEIDVLHSPLWQLPAVLPCRSVVTIHDAIPAMRPDLTSEAFAPLWRRAQEEGRRADAVVCPSEHARTQVIDALGLDPEKVHVIPEAPDPVFSPRGARDLALALDALDVHEPYLLAVGSLERRKNPDGVLDALALLPAERRPLILFAGPAAGFHICLEAQRRGLGDRVRALGVVSDDALAALYTGALAVLVCSRAEGFGLPVVEAWACGAPVIASNVTALPEVADDAALLVDPESPAEIASAIASLLDAPALRDDLRAKGAARLERCFSPTVVRQAFAALYDSLAAEVTS
jgi:glycosyltransferase involved in cell wall biosynthesis